MTLHNDQILGLKSPKDGMRVIQMVLPNGQTLITQDSYRQNKKQFHLLNLVILWQTYSFRKLRQVYWQPLKQTACSQIKRIQIFLRTDHMLDCLGQFLYNLNLDHPLRQSRQLAPSQWGPDCIGNPRLLDNLRNLSFTGDPPLKVRNPTVSDKLLAIFLESWYQKNDQIRPPPSFITCVIAFLNVFSTTKLPGFLK